MENLAQFAERKRLRIKRDEVGELMIPGRIGHLYEHDCGVFGLMLVSPNGDDPKLDNTLRSRMRKALAEGLKLHQEGDYESTFTFNPDNTQHAQLAIRLVGAKRKRRATGRPFTSARARVVGKATQFQPSRRVEGPERPQTEPIPGLVGVPSSSHSSQAL